jgi:hypothetical protein
MKPGNDLEVVGLGLFAACGFAGILGFILSNPDRLRADDGEGQRRPLLVRSPDAPS